MDSTAFRFVMVKRALWNKRGKSLLIVLAVAMGASVAAALLNLEADLRHRMNRELRDYGPNVMLAPAAGSADLLLDERVLEPLAAGVQERRILAYTPQLFVPAKAGNVETIIVGAQLDSLRKLYPGWQWTSNTVDSAEGIYVGIRLAKKIGVTPGQSLDVEAFGKTRTLRVIGLVEGGEAEDDQIYADLKTAQELGSREGRFQIAAVSAMGEVPEVEAWFRNYTMQQPGVAFEVVRKIAAAETLILDRISRLMSLILAIIFITLFFCINTTVSAILLARQSEIALMRVLGARRNQIMAALTLELLTLASLGGLLGYAIGIGMAQILGKVLFQTFIVPRPGVFLVTLFSAIAMMVISSLLPIRRAINRPAALVLKEA